jgi:hypothetical protein
VPAITHVLEPGRNLSDILVSKTSITTPERHCAQPSNRLNDKILRRLSIGFVRMATCTTREADR